MFFNFRFVGDCQIPLALKMFIEEKGKELVEKRLYRNFLLHCCNMHEYNVLSPGQVFTAMTQIQRFILENNLQHHLVHWKDQTQKAFDQKGQQNLTLDTINVEQITAEQISPNCQRNDFSGIFKKEGKSSLPHLNNVSSLHSMENSSQDNLLDEDNSAKEDIKLLQVNKKGPSNGDIMSESNGSSKTLVPSNKDESDEGLVKDKATTKNEKLNASLVTSDVQEEAGNHSSIADSGKSQKVQVNGK